MFDDGFVQDSLPSYRATRRDAVSLQIELAALRLFIERDPETLTTAEIADAVGVSRRTLFRYFESRDDIIAAQSLRSARRFMEKVAERPVDEPVHEAMLTVFRELEQSKFDDEIEGLSIGILLKFPQAWFKSMVSHRPEVEAIYTRMVARRMHLAGKDDQDAAIIGSALLAITWQAHLKWAQGGYKASYPDLFERAVASLKAILKIDSGALETTRP